ncbi:hypothetical protein AHF37_10007 [Paragonimus kellicotti]|nr:hypothetical protein AHF37_10007 [Paragonimus kellicotti]
MNLPDRAHVELCDPCVTSGNLGYTAVESTPLIADHVRRMADAPAPSEPVILSPNQTELADYYMLNWKVRSRAPLKNVTVEIEEFASSNILVTGYPIPELVCDGLHLTEPRQISRQQIGGTFAYSAVVDNITQAHLTTFHCEASNELGITNESIEFTTAPSEPVILSPNQTELADYYMLNWKVRSRAPLKNVTVEIEEFASSNVS